MIETRRFGVERIGVLVVHGIGDQGPNEHRNEVAESLIRAWQQDSGFSGVVDQTAEEDDCVSIYVERCGEEARPAKVEIREVYWADADERPKGLAQKLGRAYRFWLWGLSQWGVPHYAASQADTSGTSSMCVPGPVAERARRVARVKLFGVGISFVLTGMTWELIRVLVRMLGRWRRVSVPGSGVLVRYLGDVELYTEARYGFRPSAALRTDRPRDAIRRRMVRGLVDMARRGYTRWYVVAHSLGSVVAHNGLMELSDTLPNYLNETEWSALEKELGGNALADGQPERRNMRPPRSCWLSAEHVIRRAWLFSRLRGFLSYGSPLDKFATLWPAIVPINPDLVPLKNCQWVNVFDRMDPVGGSLDCFSRCGSWTPENLSYRASWAFLLAHTKYLADGARKDDLARRLGKWIIDGGDFPADSLGRFSDSRLRGFGRYVWWLIAASVPAAVLGGMVAWVLSARDGGVTPSSLAHGVGLVLAASVALVFLVGVLRWRRNSHAFEETTGESSGLPRVVATEAESVEQ